MRGLMVVVLSLGAACWSAPEEATRQTGYLREILRQADEAYFNKHDSIMSDAAYDALRARHDELIETYPELTSADLVGAPVDAAEKVAHSSPVPSLRKAYSDAEVSAFIEASGAARFRVEPKIDGLSVILRYRNGVLERAITRGDGKAGMDVTAALLASGSVPANLTAAKTLELRGEVFIPRSSFAALNERRAADGLAPLKSPRNSAAGTLRLKDFAEVSRRGLEIRIFETRSAEPMPASASEALAPLAPLGLEPIEGKTVAAADALAAIEALHRARADWPYQTDGVVIKVDDRARFNALGATAKYPRGALARKYETEPIETTLLGVEWTRGGTGRLTPVAEFEPVEIGGATIRKASLHNRDHLRALDLKIGDRIQVTRAGGSVPEIVGVLRAARTGEELAIPEPTLGE